MTAIFIRLLQNWGSNQWPHAQKHNDYTTALCEFLINTFVAYDKNQKCVKIKAKFLLSLYTHTSFVVIILRIFIYLYFCCINLSSHFLSSWIDKVNDWHWKRYGFGSKCYGVLGKHRYVLDTSILYGTGSSQSKNVQHEWNNYLSFIF